MIPAERRRRIQKDVERLGSVTITDLSDKYEVSEMTIRRDFKVLEEQGQLRRTHGGAMSVRSNDVEPRYVAKQDVHAAQKDSIAGYAAQKFVEEGDVLILEGGTSVTTMAWHLTEQRDLTIVTNGLHTTSKLQHLLPHNTVICCGGILRDVALTFVGPTAERFFQEFYANKLFLSATGLGLDVGLTDPNMLETQVKKSMSASTESVIALIDSSKFGVKSLMTVLGVDEIDVLVTDDGAPDDMVAAMRDRGVDVHVVPATAPSSNDGDVVEAGRGD